MYPKVPSVVRGVSVVGTTNSNARMASASVNMSTGTSTSILNTSGYDAYVQNIFAYCTGVSSTNYFPYISTVLTIWQLQAATSSAVGSTTNTNLMVNTSIATTTWTQVSSTTASTAAMNSLWPSNSYLTIYTNATNTAQCTLGAYYITL